MAHRHSPQENRHVLPENGFPNKSLLQAWRVLTLDHQRRFLRERSCFILSQAAELLLRPSAEICHLEDLSSSPDVVAQPRGSGNWLAISEPGDVGGGVAFDGAA